MICEQTAPKDHPYVQATQKSKQPMYLGTYISTQLIHISNLYILRAVYPTSMTLIVHTISHLIVVDRKSSIYATALPYTG
jgi:hypothetical protein